MDINFDAIWEQMTERFALSERSVHGPSHWKNVERNGLRLAKLNGANATVVKLFAVIHDVERESDGYDPEHGRRAAKVAQELYGVEFDLPDAQMEQLLEALKYHNDGLTSEDVTIGTCWDADRMDLPRVGIQPEPKYMSTELGKEFAARFQYKNRG